MSVYLDNSATTKPTKEVADKVYEMLVDKFGNPSSFHKEGLTANDEMRTARQAVARALSCQEEEIYFTSGATEANNLAIFGAAYANRRKGNRIVTTAIEHESVLEATAQLEKEGFEVVRLMPDKQGNITADQIFDAVNSDTILVTMMYINNEVGSVLPVKTIKKAVEKAKAPALIHIDCVQAFGKVEVKPAKLGADMISVTAHKIHGPKGVGALYIRPGLPLPPFIHGGGQESNFRSGTENLPGICGFAAACAATDAQQEIARMTDLRDYCRARAQEIPGLVLIGQQAAPHIVNLSLPGLRSQGIINCLQTKGIYVSAGSACSKGHRSHVLEAMHLPPAVIDGSVRISFCGDNTREDVDRLIDALLEAKTTLKG